MRYIEPVDAVMRWPLTTLIDTGNDGHIGYAVAYSNAIAKGWVPTAWLGEIRAQAFARWTHGSYSWILAAVLGKVRL